MNDRDPQIQDLLDRRTPATPVSAAIPDWDDVVRRAAARPMARQRRRRMGWAPRGLLVAAAAFVLLGGSALAGVGPGDALVHLVKGDQQAPKRIREGLQSTFHWPNGLHVITGESRSVLRVNGITEWIAPASGDRYCLGTITRDGSSGFSCDYYHPDRTIIVLASGSTEVKDGVITGYSPPIVNGTAPAATAHVSLVFDDGTKRRLAISTAHFPNFVFFADSGPLARAHLLAGRRPLAIVARDSAGRLLATTHFLVGDFRPADASDPMSDFHPVDVPASNSSPFGLTAPGPALTWVGRATDGEVCLVRRIQWFDNDNPPVWVRSVDACGGPLTGLTAVVGRTDRILFGLLPPGATRVTVRFQDGSTVEARTSAGTWLLTLSAGAFVPGGRPTEVTAATSAGTPVATRRFDPPVDFSQG